MFPEFCIFLIIVYLLKSSQLFGEAELPAIKLTIDGSNPRYDMYYAMCVN